MACQADFNLAVVESSNQIVLSVAVKPRRIPVVVWMVSSLDRRTRSYFTVIWLPKTRRWMRSGRRSVKRWEGEMWPGRAECGSLFLIYTACQNEYDQYEESRFAPESMVRTMLASVRCVRLAIAF